MPQSTSVSRSVVLLALLAGVAYAQNPAVTIAVDANAGRHAISPDVYGVAYATNAQLAQAGPPGSDDWRGNVVVQPERGSRKLPRDSRRADCR